MNSTPHFHTRREFLRSTVLGGALAWSVPAFLSNTFSALAAGAANSSVQIATGRDHPVLVVLQLAGGNDGLNTVVPFENDLYRSARPNLGLGRDEVLNVADGIGLHAAMPGLHRLFHEGEAAILQNVGYPNPNRSHFRSMEIWHTASDADKVAKTGWLGSYFDNACAGEDAGVGVSLGRQLPQAFQGNSGKGVALGSSFGSADSGGLMMEGDDEAGDATVTDFSGEVSSSGDTLDFLRRTELDGIVTSRQIEEITTRSVIAGEFPTSALGRQLRTVAQLIVGGMPARVYYATQGGYDTHSNQAQNHHRLLSELDSALYAFLKELRTHGVRDRVMVMTFSEFGRRVAENASGGTDHGAAAPMFFLGGSVTGGMFGGFPDLKNLVRGDLPHEVDFRSVYATILDQWLGADSKKILGGTFPVAPGLQEFQKALKT